MAEANLLDSRLRLVFEAGVDDDGKPIFKAKTFNNIKKTAGANELYEAAQAISALCNYSLDSIERSDNYDIVG
ncbi:DUF1659 domain-containing protein [Bacillus aquiflavi]|uniref:DUF1659 domain-containing protein n=1 Tax=Bacillus aquiflavi TaxID=2672567 RepID=A0A6B3VXD6_9BACI|nr:DUF1659 domain-containing protein [Bacillus aquiflavi]MBA4538394.1 DUF1659 domain-containing protein [Bacillus aquiflavi]NEY82759.1 DUF1659 domain-containing protein [Bacillus aquiflavi]UAC49514.1 DUF1659 domain-containing protein [Bacillus aquiflavi]